MGVWSRTCSAAIVLACCACIGSSAGEAHWKHWKCTSHCRLGLAPRFSPALNLEANKRTTRT